MKRQSSEKGIPAGYETLKFPQSGNHDVVIRTKVKQELISDASAEQQAGLEDLLSRFVLHGPQGLPRTKLNGNEGWFPSDKAPGKIRLQAFKPWQLRAYGFVAELNSRPTFFITGVDCSKKQDKANQAILRAAGAEAFAVSSKLK